MARLNGLHSLPERPSNPDPVVVRAPRSAPRQASTGDRVTRREVRRVHEKVMGFLDAFGDVELDNWRDGIRDVSVERLTEAMDQLIEFYETAEECEQVLSRLLQPKQ